MLETETIYPGGNLPKQKYLKRMWRGLAVLLLSILIILVIRSCGTTEPVPSQPAFGCEYAEEQAVEPVPETLFDEVYDYIFKLRIDHPDIVMAQCIEESGGFTSKLFVEGHNCLGMKVPGSRPTLAVGTVRSCPFQLVAGVYSRLCYMAEYICPTAHKGRIFRLFRQSLCGEEGI